MDDGNPWRGTEIELDGIKAEFIRLHNIGDKNWTPEKKAEILDLRQRCVQLGEYRYFRLRNGHGKKDSKEV